MEKKCEIFFLIEILVTLFSFLFCYELRLIIFSNLLESFQVIFGVASSNLAKMLKSSEAFGLTSVVEQILNQFTTPSVQV